MFSPLYMGGWCPAHVVIHMCCVLIALKFLRALCYNETRNSNRDRLKSKRCNNGMFSSEISKLDDKLSNTKNVQRLSPWGGVSCQANGWAKNPQSQNTNEINK